MLWYDMLTGCGDVHQEAVHQFENLAGKQMLFSCLIHSFVVAAEAVQQWCRGAEVGLEF